MSDNIDDTQLANSDEVPVWSKNYLPDNATLIMLTEETNYDQGGTISAAYQLKLDRIVPNNVLQGNIFTIVDPAAGITVPPNIVVPAYVESSGNHGLKRAQASSITTKARFLITGANQNVDEGYVVQSSGYYTFAEDHDYDIGLTYYLSDTSTGGVTSSPPSGIQQPLFYVLDGRTIQLLIGV